MSFPTKKEIQQMIDEGAKCPRCNTNPATLGDIQGQPCIAMCENCHQEVKTKYPVYKDNSMGGNQLASVWDHPSGEKIPVNSKGNIIHTEPKYERRKGEKPLW